jgi:hypothetical protein
VTPSDEFQFWAATVTENAVGGRAVLKAVNAAFEPLRSSFAALDTLQHSELEEVCVHYYHCCTNIALSTLRFVASRCILSLCAEYTLQII